MPDFKISMLQRNVCAAGDAVLGRYETGSLIASVQGGIYSVPKTVAPRGTRKLRGIETPAFLSNSDNIPVVFQKDNKLK